MSDDHDQLTQIIARARVFANAVDKLRWLLLAPGRTPFPQEVIDQRMAEVNQAARGLVRAASPIFETIIAQEKTS